MGQQLPTSARVILFGVFSLLGPRAAVAAPPASGEPGAERRVNLVLDASILGSEVAPRLEVEIAGAFEPVLEQADLSVTSASQEAGAQTLSVRVIEFDEEQRNYAVELRLGSEDGVATTVTERCDACGERRLIAKLAERTLELVELHEACLVKEDDAIAPELPPPEPPQEPTQVDEAPRRLIGPLGGTGAGMLGVGVLGLAAGAYLFGRADDEVDDGSPEGRLYGSVTKFQPAGVATLAAGGLVAVVGISLLALDLERARKGRGRRFALQMTPTYLGFQIQQRF